MFDFWRRTFLSQPMKGHGPILHNITQHQTNDQNKAKESQLRRKPVYTAHIIPDE